MSKKTNHRDQYFNQASAGDYVFRFQKAKEQLYLYVLSCAQRKVIQNEMF